jgi:2-oxoglutarate dehydrogenase E2 component (dihydrolipoamide succinyltransferase)
VKLGEPLVELETDKVNLEVSAAASGVLSRIEHGESEDVKVGEVLGEIQESEAAPAGEPTTPPAVPVEQPEAAKPGPIPYEGGTAGGRLQAEGETEKVAERATPVAQRIIDDQGLDITEIQGTGPGGRITKNDVEAYLQKLQAQRSDVVSPGDVGAPPAGEKQQTLQEQAAAHQAVATSASEAQKAFKQTATEHAEAASVSAQYARSAQVNAEQLSTRQKTTEQPKIQPVISDGNRPEERVRLSRRRRTIAQRLVEAQHTAAMLTTFNEVDMTAVMDLRKRRNEAFQKRYGVKLGIVSFFIKASIGALKAFPQLNAEIQGDDMILKYYYDIGVAVGSPEGLVVPVIRDAGRLSFAQIEQKIREFTEKTENGTLSLEDLRGGTFTITNGGVFGSLMSTPILTPPQVGILGLHKIEQRPIALNSEVVIRPMMYVALSYDHRIVDGREAVQFLVRIKEMIEDPEEMLLEG